MTSSMRVIWLKMSTRDWRCCSFGSRRSSRTILPATQAAVTRQGVVAAEVLSPAVSQGQEHAAKSCRPHACAPEFSTRCSSVVNGGPGSAPWNRYLCTGETAKLSRL